MKINNLDVYVRSMGKALRVVAWFPDTDEGTEQANRHMENHRDDAVVASTDGLILLARTWDKGEKIGNEHWERAAT